ncbi:hypothetical protein E2651_24830 [Streptomyces sp. MZ04]|nr:hypothetical protein E2651_24830 [Streptomyces sp. MZ04]
MSRTASGPSACSGATGFSAGFLAVLRRAAGAWAGFRRGGAAPGRAGAAADAGAGTAAGAGAAVSSGAAGAGSTTVVVVSWGRAAGAAGAGAVTGWVPQRGTPRRAMASR